jgi:hypothetical protein
MVTGIAAAVILAAVSAFAGWQGAQRIESGSDNGWARWT